MSDSDGSLGESSATLDRRDQDNPKVKRHGISHYRPRHNLINLEQLEQQRKASRPKGDFNISSGRPLGDKPRTTRRPPNIPPGSKMLGGFIIPPFFSLSRHISKAPQQDASSSNLTLSVSNFFGKMLNKIKSPMKLFNDDVVNIAPDLDVGTGNRPSISDEQMKGKTYVANCLKKKSSFYTPEEKKRMTQIKEILVGEKKERESKKAREQPKTRSSLKLRKGPERKVAQKEVGEIKRKVKRNADSRHRYRDEKVNSTLGTTDNSNQHPSFAREFREKVRIYTPSGTELNVDSKGGFSRLAPSRAKAEQLCRHRIDLDEDDEVEFTSSMMMEEKRKKRQQPQIDPAQELEILKMIHKENKRTLKMLNMKTAKETLRPSPNMETSRTIKKTRTGGSGLKREPIKSMTRSSSEQSNTPRSDVPSASVSVIEEDSDNGKNKTNVNRQEKSVKVKACSTDILVKKRKVVRSRKTESRDFTVNNVVAPKVKEEMETRHKDKTANLEVRKKEMKLPEKKNLKSKTPERKKSNKQGVDSKLDDDSKTDNLQGMIYKQHSLQGKSNKKRSLQAKPLVTKSSCRNIEHPDLMHHDQQKCAQTLNREYSEEHTGSGVEYSLENNSATDHTSTECVDYDTSLGDSVTTEPSEDMVERITIFKEAGTKHVYYYANQGDSSDNIDARNASLRGIVPSTTTTTTCEREECTLVRGHQREDHRYGNVRLADEVICEETEFKLVNTPSSTEKDTTAVSDCKKPPPSCPSKASCRRCVHKKPKDTRSVLTTSQESMAEADKQQSSATTARRANLNNKRNEAIKHSNHAGRRSQASNFKTSLNQIQGEEYRQTKNMTRKWDRVLQDSDHVKRERPASVADESHKSVKQVLEVMAKAETSSPDLETSTEEGLSFGSKLGPILPRFAEEHVPDLHASPQLWVQPTVNVLKEELATKVDRSCNAEDPTEDARAVLLAMLKKAQMKAEKLGRIRKVMEVVDEHCEIGYDPKLDLLADMILAVNMEGNDDIKHVESPVEQKRNNERFENAKDKRPSSQLPDTCIQHVQPVVASQDRKSKKHTNSLAKKHIAPTEHQERGLPHIDRKTREIQEEGKTHRDKKKNITVGTMEYLEKVQRTAKPHMQKPTVIEAGTHATDKTKQHGGGRHSLAGKCTAPQCQRDVSVKEVPNAISQRRGEGGCDEVFRLEEKVKELNGNEEQVKNKSYQVDKVVKGCALACGENNKMFARNDSSKLRQENVSEIMSPRSVTTSCCKNNSMKHTEDKIRIALAEYFGEKTMHGQFMQEEKLGKHREERSNETPRNDNCTLECCRGHPRDNAWMNQSAQQTNIKCEDRERALQQDNTTCKSGTQSSVLSSVLDERENIISLSHKYAKPLEFKSNKPRMSFNSNCNNVTRGTFSKKDKFREDCVGKTCNADVSNEVKSPPKNNHVAGKPRVISLMDPLSHFQRSTNVVDEHHDKSEGSVSNDHCKLEKSPTVRRSCVDKSHRASDPNKEDRAPQQRLASGNIGDNNCATTLNITERQECKPRQQSVNNMNPTSDCRMGMALRNLNPTSSDSTQHGLGSSRANNVREGFLPEAEQVEDTHSNEKIPPRRDVNSTHGDSANDASCINTPDKALQKIFKKIDDVITNKFFSSAPTDAITIVVTPQIVFKDNNEAGSDDFKEDNTVEKLDEIIKEEFKRGQVGKKKKELCRRETATVDEGAGSSKQVASKLVSVNEKSVMFPPEVYKNEHKMSLGNRAECPIPGDRGEQIDRTLMDRIETVIGNQERIQELALRNSHKLESVVSCELKKSDVYILSQVLCKSLGAIRRKKKHAEMRLRRSKTTKTRFKPWRVRRVNETPYGDSVAKQRRQVSAGEQMDAETSGNLRLLEEIVLLNVPDKTPFSPKKRNNFDRCDEQVLRCLPTEMVKGFNGPEKELGKVSSQASLGEKMRKADNEVPVDRFQEKVSNNLDVDELKMLEFASPTTVNVPTEQRNYSKHADVNYHSRTNNENNSTSTGVVKHRIKTFEEVIAEAINKCGPEGRKNVLKCLGVDNMHDLIKPLTTGGDVIENAKPSSRHGGSRERERTCGGGSHLKARHGHGQIKSHRRGKEDRMRCEEEIEDDKETKVEAARKSHSASDSDGTMTTMTATAMASLTSDHSIPSSEGSFESEEVCKHRRLSGGVEIDKWIRDGAVATKGSTKPEENIALPSTSESSSKKEMTENDFPVNPACNKITRYVIKYALKSGIILSREKSRPTSPDNNENGDCVRIKLDLGDDKPAVIVVQLPEEDEFKVTGNSSRKRSISSSESQSSTRMKHFDSDTTSNSGMTEAAPRWTRAEQEAFVLALRENTPSPELWDSIAEKLGRSKRDCVLSFIKLWRRIEKRVADGLGLEDIFLI